MKALLGVTIGPAFRSIDIYVCGSYLTVQKLGRTTYSALVGREREVQVEGERALNFMVSLMRRVASMAKSNYYTFIGEAEVTPRRVIYEPNILPSLKARITVTPRHVKVSLGPSNVHKLRSRATDHSVVLEWLSGALSAMCTSEGRDGH